MMTGRGKYLFVASILGTTGIIFFFETCKFGTDVTNIVLINKKAHNTNNKHVVFYIIVVLMLTLVNLQLLLHLSQVGPRQANLCLRAFRHDKFQLRMPSHSEGPGIWFSV